MAATAKKAAAKPTKKTTARKPAAKKPPAKSPTKKAVEGGATASAAASRKKAGDGVGRNAAPSPVAPTFNPAYPVADMKQHPKNPRRHTAADEDMVASIKEHGLLEPVILAPDGTLIAGNRRHDGLKKAKKTTAPALIRPDLDTPEKQLEAALIENCHRENLTPIEEAEAFAMFQGMGYTQAKIATKVGRPVAMVRDRLKLLKLDKSAQDKIHDGQLTLGHALDLVSFDDDPKVQKKLAKAAIEGGNFEYQLRQEKERRATRQRIDRHVEELTGLGVPALDVEKGVSYYQIEGAQHLGSFGASYGGLQGVSLADLAKKMHKGCLAYLVEDDNYTGRQLRLFCTDDASHNKERAAEDATRGKEAQERQAQWEREQAEHDRQRANEKISADLRTTAVMSSIGPGLKLDGAVVNVLRTLLPSFLIFIEEQYGLEAFYERIGVPEEKQWSSGWNAKDEDHEKAIAFISDLGQASPYTLASTLFAILVDCIESALHPDDPVQRLGVRRYFELLTDGLGHQLTEVDEQLLKDAQEPVEDEPIDPYTLVHAKGGNEPGVETPCGLRATVGKSLHTNPELDNLTCPTCIDALDVA